ncbi:MAG: glycosyltransferase [Thermoguttaceae bacterium]|jgi:glycosyltransferase involved in cell wall biosynthesis
MPTAVPRILAVMPGFIPSTMITVVRPLVRLHEAGRVRARINLESLTGPGDVRRADAVIFCRNVKPAFTPLLEAALARRIPILYDLDDNFFDFPPDADAAGYLDPSRQAMLADYVRSASLVRVYSAALLARVSALNPRAVRSFAPIDLSLVGPPGAARPSGGVSIVYATSRAEDALADLFLPALARLLRTHAGRVQAHFWGYKPPRLAQLPGARHHAVVCRYERFLRRFSRAGFAVGLAPLLDDLFHRSKTNNKFREYGACHVAGIYSNVEVYSECVVHGQTGLLVANHPDRWYEALVELVENPGLRAGIQRQARAYVEEHYRQDEFERVFWRQIQELLDDRAECRVDRAQRAPPEPRRTTDDGRRAVALPSVARRPSSVEDGGAHPSGSTHVTLFRRAASLRRHGLRRTWEAARWKCSDWSTALELRWRLRR